MIRLSERQKSIISIIVKNKEKYITIAEIAGIFNLSNRTVLRDFSKIEKWFSQNDFNISSKPGSGISVDETDDNKLLILELLEVDKVDKAYSKEERITTLKIELLKSDQPVKLYYYSKVFNISEGTLNKEIKLVEDWLKKFNIKLVRQKGVGMYVEGTEKSLRDAQIDLIYDGFKHDELLSTIRDVKNIDKYDSEIFDLLDADIIKTVKDAFMTLYDDEDVNLADNSAVALIVHISLALQRIEKGDRINMNANILDELKRSEEYKMASKIANRLSKLRSYDIPEEEIAYITMHLQGAKFKITDSDRYFDYDNLDLDYILNKFLEFLSRLTSVDLLNDYKLYSDLKNHMKPAIARIKNNMDIRNPILNDVKSKYENIFEKVVVASDVVRDFLDKDIPESEIGYITMHIGAALERDSLKEDFSDIRAAVVCPTGIGTSSLLGTNMKKAFKGINILSSISSFDLDEDGLKREGVDVIVSTVNVRTDKIKSIVVSPFLNADDKIKLSDFFLELRDKRKNEVTKIKSKRIRNENKLSYDEIFNISSSVVHLIDFLKNSEKKVIKKEVIDRLGSEFKEDLRLISQITTDGEDALVDDIMSRVDISTPIFHEARLLYLHCKTFNSDESKIFLSTFEKDYEIEGSNIKTVLTFILKENDEYAKKAFSYIFDKIAEQDEMVNALKMGKIETIEENITSYLKRFLAESINKENK